MLELIESVIEFKRNSRSFSPRERKQSLRIKIMRAGISASAVYNNRIRISKNFVRCSTNGNLLEFFENVC